MKKFWVLLHKGKLVPWYRKMPWIGVSAPEGNVSDFDDYLRSGSIAIFYTKYAAEKAAKDIVESTKEQVIVLESLSRTVIPIQTIDL